ncbi:MAG TPA: 1-deoxy-D-xylulose-5-phosphate synthase [Clostridiaceae bacterium]|nr:1-deoxy-D-xylulose-5-phosphate synthase [Clostridiaceae bacterium]
MSEYKDKDSWPRAQDIKGMTLQEKKELADRLRDYIIKYTAKNGGHLSSNLGVVELTIALLAVYDFPTDSLIFDVGHQCYSWKILTNRAEEFKQLRQEGGLSGFPKSEESEYDSFNTGHSSTSLSAACGLVRARKLRRQGGKVVAVIGDGAMSGGMAYEAMNDICQCGDDIVIVLNDNQMSIDHVVGGFAKHLEYLRLAPGYISLKSRWLNRFQKVPLFGKLIVKVVESFKRAGRNIIHHYRGSSSMFEQLGFKYYGPADGHDIARLERYLRSARAIKGPVLIHTITQKGRGYSFAEEKPSAYHGVAPFEIYAGLNGSNNGDSLTWSEVFGREIVRLGRENKDICAISAAMTAGTGLLDFEKEFPDRFFDVGIAEQHALTLAAGLAKGGMRPYVALYSTFLQRGLDQLLHDICMQNLPVTVTVDRAGAVGSDGETHQGIYDLALTLPFPNLEIYAPATAADLRALLELSLKKDNPMLIRYPKEKVNELPDTALINSTTARDFDPAKLRKMRSGEDLAIIALGTMVFPALAAAEHLSAKGINISVYSTICGNSCIIHDIMNIISKWDKLLFIEDGIKKSGWGEYLIAQLNDSVESLIAESMGILYPLAGQASRTSLLHMSGLDTQGIVKKVESLIIQK